MTFYAVQTPSLFEIGDTLRIEGKWAVVTGIKLGGLIVSYSRWLRFKYFFRKVATWKFVWQTVRDVWCFLAGHNITLPYPNKKSAICWRCRRELYF